MARTSAFDYSPEEFKKQGYELIDKISDHLASLRQIQVTNGCSPKDLKSLLPKSLPKNGENMDEVWEETCRLLFDNSLYNGHPKFWGFITSSASPVGNLAELLASVINQNLGGQILSPLATEIEIQTLNWIAEFIGYPTHNGAILVSGGNMANMVGFWVGRKEKIPWDIRKEGINGGNGKKLCIYTSKETHTWVEKATDLSGLGTDSIRWIPTDKDLRMSEPDLISAIEKDRSEGNIPIMVIGTAGSVSTGAVDPLQRLREIADKYNLWYHMDGAYGAPAAMIDGAPEDLKHLYLADSLAIDPHKWLYAPLEAGAVFVKDKEKLRNTFSYHPDYYPDEDRSENAPTMYHEFGPQNSRGFRALKIWMGFRQAGSSGLAQMIMDDMNLSQYLFELAERDSDLETFTQGLSIATFRYNPPNHNLSEEKLNQLNKTIVESVQNSGKIFPTHALLDGKYVIRFCNVNFRTEKKDLEEAIELIKETGRKSVGY